MGKTFIEYLEEQQEMIGTLIEQLKRGEGEQSTAIFHVDVDRLTRWLNGHDEDLSYVEKDV